MTSTTPLRVGVAGLGGMGRNHLRNLRGRPDVRLVGVADPEAAARGAALTDAPDARTFADALDLIADGALDALIVAAPTTLHHVVTLAALRAEVPVLVEKPLAASVEEGRELVQAADASGVLLQVGHVERFNPAVAARLARLHDGALTRVFRLASVRAGPMPAQIRDVGVAIDLATHETDIQCLIAGERPVRISAEVGRFVRAEHEDLLSGLLIFPGGAVGRVDVDWLTPSKHRLLTVLGPEGLFELDYLRQTLSFTTTGDDPAPALIRGFAPTFTGRTIRVPVAQAEPLRLEQDAFFVAIRSGGPSPVSATDGLWALALAESMLASAARGQPISIGVDPFGGGSIG